MSHTHLQTFVPQAPPDDPTLMNEYHQRMYKDLASNLEQVADGRFTDKRHVVPDKPRDGMIAYADGTDWNPGEGEGFYGYVNGAWVAQGQLVGAVLDSDYVNNSMRYKNNVGTMTNLVPAAQSILYRGSTTIGSIPIGTQEIIGRLAGGMQAITAAEERTRINVEDGSTADQSDAEIKTAYENNSDTNEFSDAEQTKLSNLSMELLATASASASASIDFDSAVDFSAYGRYIFVGYDIDPATDGTELMVRISIDGGTGYRSTAADYFWIQNWVRNNAVGQGTRHESTDNTAYRITGADAPVDTTNASSTAAFVLNLYNPSSTTRDIIMDARATVWDDASGRMAFTDSSGVFAGSSGDDVDGLQILMSSGNITSGEFACYGVT